MVRAPVIVGSGPRPVPPTLIVFAPEPMPKEIVSAPLCALAALIASRRVQSAELQVPSVVSFAEFTVNVEASTTRACRTPRLSPATRATISRNTLRPFDICEVDPDRAFATAGLRSAGRVEQGRV